MKKSLLGLVCFYLMITFLSANAAVLNFDDIPGADPSDWNNPVPNGYGGLNWDWVYVIDKDLAPGTGYDNGVVSGDWAAYNVWNLTALVTGTTFDFVGAYFTSAWDSVNTLTITGYSAAGTQTATVTLNDQSPTWFQADWTGLDTLSFSTSGTQFVMDNFTYNPAPVPEPGALLLLGSGMVSFIMLRRKWAGR